ncbi:MAG: glycerophosphodiester phosphodiesterase [Gammaproteobacteria bacterium]|nr:glycerophosphodiester phosphodiesterase [Gammaproteobacteria bacterium]
MPNWWRSKLGLNTKIIAHRGASEDAPENTLASVASAFDQNADGVEVDVRLTKDNQIVCHHDKSCLRTSGNSMNIKDSNYEELNKLDVGSWFGDKWREESIPLLREVIDLIPNEKEIYIEVKTGTEIIEHLLNEIYQYKEKINKMSIISFYPEVIKEIKSMAPELTGNLLVNFESPKLIEENEIVSVMNEINADGVGAQNHECLDFNFCNKINKEKKKVHVWTVNSKEEAKKYYELGLNSITSNCPGNIKEYLSNSI